MSWVRVVACRLLGLFEQKQLERELDDEVRFHLEMQIDDNVRAGMNPAEARYTALRSFGAIEQMKESYRERRTFTAIETTVQDVRYAFRTLHKSPGFTIASVAVLAIGIGANAAMFSVLHETLFQSLPYRSPEQLAMLWSEIPSQNLREDRSSYWNIEQWRSQSESFADMAFFDGASGTLTTADNAEKISIVRISPNFFELLGVRPLVGRTFSAAEAEQGQRLVLISDRFWRSHFAGSLRAIGAPVNLDGLPSRVIGVIPATFPKFLADADVWEPHTMVPDWAVVRRTRGSGFWTVIGRLRPNVAFAQAQAEMSAIARHLDEQLPLSEQNRGISVVPLSVQVTGPRARLALWMLTGAVFCVLLVAATNVASLSLARSTRREKEIAIRATLGASRARIVRQLLAENLILAISSGLLGLFVAHAAIRFILFIKPGNLARLNEIGLNPRVLGCALVLCLLTGILVGLAPALTVTRANFMPKGQQGGRWIAGGIAMRRIRRALVASEFALAILLLVGAGLLIRSLRSVERVELGFSPERVLSIQLSTPAAMTIGQRANFYNRVLEQTQSLTGVASAGIIENFFTSSSAEQTLILDEGARTISEHLRFRSDAISGGFFRTLGAPLLSGRFFSPQDRPDSPRVAILNREMARRLWPARGAVGRRFKFGESEGMWITVIGVVGDMRRHGLENAPVPQMFVPMTQDPSRLATLLIQTSMDDPIRMAGAVQATLHRVEKYVPFYGVTSLENQLGDSMHERRFQTSLLTAFSAIALLLAAIGIYGLVQYSVATRTQEIGVRMAVGAETGEIFRMVIGEGLKLSLTGLALGLLGALWLGRVGSSLLFGVGPADPLTLTTVSLLLTMVAIAACYFPARRAMKVEPIVALRQE